MWCRATSYTITGEGKGGVAGFAKGAAQDRAVQDAEGGGTDLHYDVEAKVGGKIAQLGSRLVDSFATRMADQFFERFQALLEGHDGDDGRAEASTGMGMAAMGMVATAATETAGTLEGAGPRGPACS
jgi:hypothetical protein